MGERWGVSSPVARFRGGLRLWSLENSLQLGVEMGEQPGGI